MARLIDIEAINWYDDLFMKGENHSGVWVRYRDVEKLIRNAPTVDAVPVARKPVKGYEGYYEVDSLGRVYGLDRVIFVDDNGRKYEKPIFAKKLSQTIKSNGYKSVTLTKDGVSKAFYVHRIVAEAFIPNPDKLPMVNHKDEDKTNNFVENLEWCTNEYNINYGTGKERRTQKIRGRVSPHAVLIEAFGEKKTRKEWSAVYGIDPRTIERRMSLGWSAEDAITTPLKKNQYAFKNGERKGGDE